VRATNLSRGSGWNYTRAHSVTSHFARPGRSTMTPTPIISRAGATEIRYAESFSRVIRLIHRPGGPACTSKMFSEGSAAASPTRVIPTCISNGGYGSTAATGHARALL
jgi:hypothetical protein